MGSIPTATGIAHPSEPRARKVGAGVSKVRVPFSCIVSEFMASASVGYKRAGKECREYGQA